MKFIFPLFMCMCLFQVTQSDEIGRRLYIWKEGRPPERFEPSGLMPDGDGISVDAEVMDAPHTKPYHVRLNCKLAESTKGWVGTYFLWHGEWNPKRPLNVARKLDVAQGDKIRCRFYARSRDLAWAKFQIGGIVLNGKPIESLKKAVATDRIRLTKEWKGYEIALDGHDVSAVVGAFAVIVEERHNDKSHVSIDVDSVYLTKIINKNEQSQRGQKKDPRSKSRPTGEG